MGILDDAIREHLELKRRQGTSEQEIQRQEEEALGRGGPPLEASPAATAPDEEIQPFEPGEDSFGPAGPVTPDPEELAAEVRAAESPPVRPEPVDVEPDEVLPEEALELEPPVPDDEPPDAQAGMDSPGEWLPAEAPEHAADLDEDLLEETPEFLDDAPGQDRLWFEQKPPKDFDFDD